MTDIEKALSSFPDLFFAGGVSREEIHLAENALQLSFSEEYVQYLLQFGIAAYDGHRLTGICKTSRLGVVQVTQEEWRRNPNVPADFYVIEVANIDRIIIWQRSTGEIFQTAYDSPPVQICGLLSEFIGL